MTKQTELVEVTVKIPKNVLEFYQALFQFTRSKEPLEKFLGHQIVWALDSDLYDAALDSLVDVAGLVKQYGLKTVQHPA